MYVRLVFYLYIFISFFNVIHTAPHRFWSKSYSALLYTIAIIFIEYTTYIKPFHVTLSLTFYLARSVCMQSVRLLSVSLCAPYILNVQVLCFIKTFLKINSTSGVEEKLREISSEMCVLFVYVWSRIPAPLFGSLSLYWLCTQCKPFWLSIPFAQSVSVARYLGSISN